MKHHPHLQTAISLLEGSSLNSLAERLGVSYQAIHNWKKGSNKPNKRIPPLLLNLIKEKHAELGAFILLSLKEELPVSTPYYIKVSEELYSSSIDDLMNFYFCRRVDEILEESERDNLVYWNQPGMEDKIYE